MENINLKIKNMKLGEFIEKFSHNNIVRLVYENKGGHEIVLETWDDVSMDWEIIKGIGKLRHYINNEVLGIASIGTKKYSDAINIVIERLENQPLIDEILDTKKCCSESISDDELKNEENNIEEPQVLIRDCYWVEDEWKQPLVKIKHGDLVDIKHEGYLGIMLGRYIGKGYGVVELYNYATGIKYVVGKVESRGLNRNPILISDENLFDFIND